MKTIKLDLYTCSVILLVGFAYFADEKFVIPGLLIAIYLLILDGFRSVEQKILDFSNDYAEKYNEQLNDLIYETKCVKHNTEN